MATNESKAVARLGLTIGLGAWLGAPGYIAGGVLGAVLFPPDAPEAPDPYTALNMNTAEEGAADPLHYGVVKVKGNFIYKGPLQSRKIEEGGKGGQKTVTGYKYWTWAALGLGRGILDITRMWKNDDVLVPESDSSITIYRGTDDQTRDPDWDLRADDVVPLKREAYIYFNRFYLGEENNRFPTMSSEVHRLPFDDSLDSVAPYVLNKVKEPGLGGDTVLRDKYDKIYVFTQTAMKVYSAGWELQKTVDLTNLNLSGFPFLWDVCFTYSGGRTMVNIASNSGIDGKVYMYRYSADRGSLTTEKTPTTRGQFTKTELYDFAPNGVSTVKCRSNSQYIFVATDYLAGAVDLLKVSTNGQTLLAHYDMTPDFDIAAFSDIALNEDFLFWCNTGGKTSTINFNGVRQDTITPSGAWAPEKIETIAGGQILMGAALGIQVSPPDVDYDRIQFLTYDRTTGVLSANTAPDLDLNDEWWTGGASPYFMNSVEGRLHEGPNGTVYITGHDGVDTYYTMELIIDANPAQIIYDLFKNTKGFDLTMVDETQLATVGDVCFDNRIGMSFSVVRKRNVGAVVRDILGHIQAHAYQTPEGKFGFFMPNSNDAVVDTIEEADILAIKNEAAPDLTIVSSSMKDIGLCPNRLNVVYENRLNQYKKDATFQLDDMLSQDLDGEVIEENLNYQMFSNPAVISKMAWKAWKIGRFQNLMHTTLLNSRWLKIRHGEVYNLNFPSENLNNARCRVFSIDDPPVGIDAGVMITWMMDDEYLTSYEEIDYDPSISEDTSVGPPEEVAPLIWEEDARYNNDTYHMGFSAIRNSEATAYCDIWASLDAPDDFFFMKRLTQFGNVGDLVADINTRHDRLKVNTDNYTGSTFVTYSKTNQRNNLSYCLIGSVPSGFDPHLGNMEFITYQDSVVSGSDLELRDLVRGKDYTIPKEHEIADDTVVVHVGITYNKIEIPTEFVGKKIYFKFVPYNLRGDGLELDDVDTYEYTIKGYTRKATHADRVQIEDSSLGELGERTKTGDSDVKIIWEYTNRNSGMGTGPLDTWEWQGWQAGDVDDYDIIILQSDGETVQAEHLGIGVVDEYTYTDAQNAIDFGGVASDHFFVGVRPVVTGRGVGREGFDLETQEVERV